MELSARLKARAAQGGISEATVKAMLDRGIDEDTIVALIGRNKAIEEHAALHGIAYKASSSTPNRQVDVQAVLKRYESLLAADPATAEQFATDLAAWVAGWQPGQTAAAQPPVAAAKTEQNGLQQAVATLFPHLADTR